MRKRATMILTVGLLTALSTAPAAARGAAVDRIGPLETVLAVAIPEDFPVASLMRADCSGLIRIERPDGSAVEIQDCQLSDNPVMIPEFQGQPPRQAFVHEGGPCRWHSDYWFSVAGTDVLAAAFRYVVTPSGHVNIRSEYPAEPLVCE